jgi:hypothetical protein
VPLLAVLALVQLALPVAEPAPPPGRVARLPAPPMPRPPALLDVPPVLARRPLFAPPGSAQAQDAGATPDAAPDPLGGARIAGMVRLGPTLRAVVQRPDGTIAYVGIGGKVGAWRLAALTDQAARLIGPGGATLAFPFGARTALPAPPPASDDDQ